jgi:hypothetical protein
MPIVSAHTYPTESRSNLRLRGRENASRGVSDIRSRYRRIVVTLYPAGFIGLRLEKCHHEETLSIRAAYETAVQTRVMRKRSERDQGKGCRVNRSRL